MDHIKFNGGVITVGDKSVEFAGHVIDCNGGPAFVFGEDTPHWIECIRCGSKLETNSLTRDGHGICPHAGKTQ